MKFVIFEGKRIDQWPEQTYYTWIFIKLTHFFIKSDKIGRVTRIVCVTHGFGLAVFFMSLFFLRFYWLTIFFNTLFFSSLLEVVVVVGVEATTEDDRSRRGGVGQRGWSLWGGTGTGTEGGELCVHFTKGGRWHHICKRGEGDLQIVLLARFGALWCQEREH